MNVSVNANGDSVLGADNVSVGTPVGVLFGLFTSGVPVVTICQHYPWLDAEEVREVLTSEDFADEWDRWIVKVVADGKASLSALGRRLDAGSAQGELF